MKSLNDYTTIINTNGATWITPSDGQTSITTNTMSELGFNWLVDLTFGKWTNGMRCSNKLSKEASRLLKKWGYQKWYTDKGRVELMNLRSLYQEELKEWKDEDLPF